MPKINFPRLHDMANERAMAAQGRHFGLVILEYAILVSTALITLSAGLGWLEIPPIVYMSCFLVLVVIATTSHFSGQDKSWLKARMIAESVKSASWLYVMGATPYHSQNADEKFRQNFHRTAEMDRVTLKRAKPETDCAVTDEMKSLRGNDLQTRLDFYLQARLQDQIDWYQAKSKTNASKARNWYLAACIVYLFPIALIPTKVFEGGEYWPIISLLLLIGSSLLGWTKAKRFRELATSYKQTAAEILTIYENAGSLKTEDDLDALVVSTETAFSQEHLGWVISNR